jgi:hypothetical protein
MELHSFKAISITAFTKDMSKSDLNSKNVVNVSANDVESVAVH